MMFSIFFYHFYLVLLCYLLWLAFYWVDPGFMIGSLVVKVNAGSLLFFFFFFELIYINFFFKLFTLISSYEII